VVLHAPQPCLVAARPKVSWVDPALIALLLGLIPRTRHARMRLIVTPGTILRWRHDLLRHRWARRSMPKGRPPTRRGIKTLVLRMDRPRTTTHWPWSGELPALAGVAILATDFFTVDLLNGTTAHVLRMIEHASRRIHVLGATAHSTAEWTTQTARNVLMDLGERADRFTFLIRDHGPQFTAGFDAVFHTADIRVVTNGIQAPVMDAIRERWRRTVRTESLCVWIGS